MAATPSALHIVSLAVRSRVHESSAPSASLLALTAVNRSMSEKSFRRTNLTELIELSGGVRIKTVFVDALTRGAAAELAVEDAKSRATDFGGKHAFCRSPRSYAL